MPPYTAASFELVLSESPDRYIPGLTATPNRQGGLQKIMFMLAGKVRYRVLEDINKKFSQRVFVKSRSSEFQRTDEKDTRLHISEIYQWLSEDEQRNIEIVDDILNAVKEDRHCLLLSERRDHANKLMGMLVDKGVNSVLLTAVCQHNRERTQMKNSLKLKCWLQQGNT